ncbi:MAG: glutaredoxin [Thiobacillaceae bacterium]
MKFLIRYFFKTLRLIIGPILLLVNWITQPKGIVRPAAEQLAIDQRTQHLALYHFPTCPFCLKVRRTIRRLSLKIDLRDAQHDPVHRQALLEGGGRIQTPCLRITEADGKTTWKYESADILAYLEQTFAA